jgi:BirA family transcriptional regulator, biotin operon repressor / biotin---[acetyl-CoA-carboxylase] ligase
VTDSLAPEHVEPLLRGRLGRPYRWVERCASTQRLLGPEEPEGALVVTDEQTEGRGRLGRGWEAPAGTSLLFSLRLLPSVPGERLPELTVVAAEAVADAIGALTALEPDVKHPNDVLVRGRKAAGVLAEAVDGRVTLGIGVNVNQTAEHLPAETRLPPTSLRVETGRAQDRAQLLAELLDRLERRYDGWLARTG